MTDGTHSPELLAYRPKHIPALDGIRGLAVLIVFVFHYGGGTHSSFAPMRWFGIVNKGGWSGVILFFVLSGFLITGILWDSYDDPHWFRKFFARRSLRIFPLYYLALLLVVLGAVAQHAGGAALARIWDPALFLEDFPGLDHLSSSIVSPFSIFHLWSIAVEEQFYLIWPWLLLLAHRRAAGSADGRIHAKNLCLGVFVFALSFRAVVYGFDLSPSDYDHFLLTHAGALALGGWLALCYRGPEWARIVRLAPIAGAAGLLLFLVTGIQGRQFETTGRHMMTYGLPGVTLFFAALLTLTLQPGLLARAFSMGWLRYLGNLSYGIYVFHMLFLAQIQWLTMRVAGQRSAMVQNAAQFAIAAAVSLVAAVISYHLYEKQFLRLKKYFIPQTHIA